MVAYGPPADVAFSPDGRLLATAGIDEVVILWDTQSWTEVRRLPDTPWVTGVAFLPDAPTLVTAGPGGSARLWDIDTGELVGTLSDHRKAVVTVAVSRDGRLLATGGADGAVQLWDLATKERRALLETGIMVQSLGFSADGNRLAASESGLGALGWHLEEGQVEGEPMALHAAPSDSTLTRSALFGLGLLGAAGTAHAGGVPSAAPFFASTDTMVSSGFRCPLAFSPDGALLAVVQHARSLSGDYKAQIYDMATQARIAEANGALSALASSPDGRSLAASTAPSLSLYDPRTGKKLR